ncbi:hypothetical protein GOODEAATRI_030981, partial [Goodea atripinnis]
MMTHCAIRQPDMRSISLKSYKNLSRFILSSGLRITPCRCCDKKSCGNRNETPSDPVIID